jgi:hypothetical protein
MILWDFFSHFTSLSLLYFLFFILSKNKKCMKIFLNILSNKKNILKNILHHNLKKPRSTNYLILFALYN